MLYRIDFDAATAVYRQLVDQVRYAAAAGTLKPRDPLPPIRSLARQLHLNRNTVAKAYTELESLGVTKTIPGKGSFVTAANTPFTPAVRNKLLITKIDAALVSAHQLQVDARSFAALVAERTRFFERKNRDAKKPNSSGSEISPAANPIRIPNRPSKMPSKQKSTLLQTPIPLSPAHSPSPLQASATDHSEGWTPSMD